MTTPSPTGTDSAPLVYEVTARVAPAAAEAYAAWLGPHIEEILSLDGFTGATWHVVEAAEGEAAEGEAAGGETDVVFCVRYGLRDRDALEAYLRDHAPRLREDGRRRFGRAFSATRRVMARRATW
ncbi:MAG: DUF4286 family protein [Rubricoccaceae bacterium]